MKKIMNLVQCEFIKNYTLLKIILTLIVLLISSIIIVEYRISKNEKFTILLRDDIRICKERYAQLLEDEEIYQENELEREFFLFRSKNKIEIYEEIEKQNENLYNNSWQVLLGTQLSFLEDENFVINQMLKHPNEKFEKVDNVVAGSYEEVINSILEKEEPIEKIKLENEKKIDQYKTLIQENKYYQYLEYQLDNYEEGDLVDYRLLYLNADTKKYYEYLISNKVEDELDFRVLNIIQFGVFSLKEKISREDFAIENLKESYGSYENYIRYIDFYNKEMENREKIISYSIYHNIKHDLSTDDTDDYYTKVSHYSTSKEAVNQGFHLSIIVLFLVIITSGGIVSKEHSTKTSKMLLTAPISRKKVLFSKFLYLILHTYIIFIAMFIFVFIYAGIKLGFTDLFTPKLIIMNGSVVEINYILYLLQEILVYSIPLIAVVSLVFLISVISLNTTLTVGIMSITTVLSPFLWQFICQMKLYFLMFTPFPYLDRLSINVYSYYLEVSAKTGITFHTGIIISIITIIVSYLISHIVYIKRDVKN